jgi:Tol biopolymer transport system component
MGPALYDLGRKGGLLCSPPREDQTRSMFRVVLVGAATLALAVFGAGATAATPAPSRQIAYIGKIPDLHRLALYIINTDGRDRQLITRGGGVADVGTFDWSPDGQQLAFTSGRPPTLYAEQISVVKADGSGLKRLTAGVRSSMNPSWSPDGELITFDRDEAVGYSRQIWVMHADGTGKRKLTHSRQVNEWPTWSPDGQKILFERVVGPEFGKKRMELYTMNRDGTEKRLIAGVKATNAIRGDYWSACTDWSPDGTKIAYEAPTGKRKPGIFVMNADGTGRKQLTHLPQTRDENPDWSPDGTQITFYSERVGNAGVDNAEIYVMNADGTNQHRITHDPWYDAGPRWRPSPQSPG